MAIGYSVFLIRICWDCGILSLNYSDLMRTFFKFHFDWISITAIVRIMRPRKRDFRGDTRKKAVFLCFSKFQMENKKTLITFKLGLEGIFVGIVILYVVALAATVTHECSFKPLKTNVCSFDKSIYCTQACNFTFWRFLFAFSLCFPRVFLLSPSSSLCHKCIVNLHFAGYKIR